MVEVQRMISVYQMGFMVSLLLFGVFFLASIVLFFTFNIPHIFQVRTGIAQKKTAKEMSKASSKTGQIRRNSIALGERTPPLGLQNKSKYFPREAAAQTAQAAEIQKEDTLAGSDQTVPLNETREAIQNKANLISVKKFTIIRNIKVTHTSEIVQ